MSETTTYLELRDLRVSYGKVEALHGISVHVEQGEIVTILGANGAGKTTTLTTISGLRKPSGGSILFQESLSVMIWQRFNLFLRKVLLISS